MPEDISAEQEKTLGDLEDFVKNSLSHPIPAGRHLKYGTFAGFLSTFDFKDANIGLLPFGVNRNELEWLRKIVLKEEGCNTAYKKPLPEVAREILNAETSFNLQDYDLYTSAGGAREAIIRTAQFLGKDGKRGIAYASPNWVFGNVVEAIPGARGHVFHASSSDEFVDNFSSLKDKDEISSLIIVNPGNPLGYTFSEEQIREIERIAEKYGIVPIFDDVFRGMRVRGERHSASEYSKNSVVVETTSKRFGARGLGVTWSLVPRGLGLAKIEGLEIACEGCSAIASMVTEGLYRSQYGERISAFVREGATAFQLGLLDSLSDLPDTGAIVHTFPEMPVMTYHFPNGTYNDIMRTHNELRLFGVSSGFNWIAGVKDREVSDAEKRLGLSYIRVCPTKEPTERAYLGGLNVGMIIKEAVKNKK